MQPILLTALISILLLGCGAHVDSVYLGREESQFLGDVSAGDLAAVEKFLDEGGNVNLQDEPGMTPLHHAANDDWKVWPISMHVSWFIARRLSASSTSIASVNHHD